jgi:glycosyltransferase involved in cell wall biosynthesis
MDDTALASAARPDAGSPGGTNASLPTVLHLIGSLDRGGTEHQLVELIRRSSDPQRHVVMTWAGSGSLIEDLPSPPAWSGGAVRAEGRSRAAIEVIREVRRVVRLEGVSVVHAHLSRSELVAAISTPRSIPIIASRRGRAFGYDQRPWFREVQGLSHRRVRLMLTNSEELATFTLRNDLFAPPVAVVPNGVDLEQFGVSPLPPDPVVTVVANLIGYKRLDLFLRAFALVVRDVPEALAILVGDGPERPALEAMASSLDLTENVRFVGQVPDVRPFVARARVVALTSDHEGLPNALLEAMAMARCVVARAVGGIPELVRDGREGWLVGGDPSSIAHGLRHALTRGSHAERVALAARQRAESFGWDSVVDRTESFYRRVAAGARWARGMRVA